jgi:hypothetical protein
MLRPRERRKQSGNAFDASICYFKNKPQAHACSACRSGDAPMQDWMQTVELEQLCRYVVGVSWPRSGHHLATNVLKEYFGDEFAHCEFYTPTDCCKTAPCIRCSRIKFSKNHDFYSMLPISDRHPYLIQYRSFLPSVVSAYEMFVGQGRPDTLASFEEFAIAAAGMYNAFLKKWVFGPNPPGERLILRYEELTSDRNIDFISSMIQFFAPNHSVEVGRIRRIRNSVQKEFVERGKKGVIDGFGIRATREIEEFRFYDRRLFGKLGALTRKSEDKSLRALGEL